MFIFRSHASALLVASTALACSNASLEDAAGSSGSAVVYDTDDRREVGEVPGWDRLFSESAVALIEGGRLARLDGGRIAVNALTLAEKYSVCPEVPFAAQPTAATCSGVLVADDIVLTAGHCFSEQPRCDRYAYVFGYAGNGASIALAEEDIYGCRDVLARRVDIVEGSRHIDFALVELDRPVRGRSVVVELEAPEIGALLVMLGFPNGLPGKLDAGARVTANAAVDHFQADLDAFGGSSGSPVFDTTGRLRGLLVAGAPRDYVPGDGCWNVRRVGADEVRQHGTERVALAGPALEALEKLGVRTPSPPRCRGMDCTANATADAQVMAPPSPAQEPKPGDAGETSEAAGGSPEPRAPHAIGCELSSGRALPESGFFLAGLGLLLMARRRAFVRLERRDARSPSGDA